MTSLRLRWAVLLLASGSALWGAGCTQSADARPLVPAESTAVPSVPVERPRLPEVIPVRLDARAPLAPTPGIPVLEEVDDSLIEPEPVRQLAAKGGLKLEPAQASSIRDVRVVRFQYTLSGASVGDRASLDIFGPAGAPYDKKQRSLVGYVDEEQQVEFVMPVAGTAIQEAALSGEWRAELSVNGQPLLVDSFGLTP